MGLNWGDRPLPGDIWQYVESSVTVTVLGVLLLASHRCRPGMLLNT